MRSTGNVFEDLGLPPEEAEHVRSRSVFMATVCKLIEDQGLTQVRAAALFGVSQPRVSDLMRGKIDLFNIDALIELPACG